MKISIILLAALAVVLTADLANGVPPDPEESKSNEDAKKEEEASAAAKDKKEEEASASASASTAVSVGDEAFMLSYSKQVAEKLKEEISEHVEEFGRICLVGSLKSETYTYGESDIDFYLMTSSSDHIKTSEEVFRVLQRNWKQGTLTVKENNRRLLNFPVDFQASDDCDLTIIASIPSESDFCQPATEAASRCLVGKALTDLKADMWRKATSTQLRRVTNILKRMFKFTISKSRRPSGYVVEFVCLLFDQKHGSTDDTVRDILSKMKAFLEEGQFTLCLEPYASEPIGQEVFTTVLDILLSNRETRVLAPSANQAFQKVIDRTTKLLCCRQELETRLQTRVIRQDRMSPRIKVHQFIGRLEALLEPFQLDETSVIEALLKIGYVLDGNQYKPPKDMAKMCATLFL